MGNIGLEPEITREFLDAEYRKACARVAELEAERDEARAVVAGVKDLRTAVAKAIEDCVENDGSLRECIENINNIIGGWQIILDRAKRGGDHD